jgi:hypothetical protein
LIDLERTPSTKGMLVLEMEAGFKFIVVKIVLGNGKSGNGRFFRQSESQCGRSGISVKRDWRKVVVVLMAGAVAIGSIIFWQRYKLAVWYMEGNKKAQEMVILQMLENARPIIEKNLKMTLPEKIFSTLTGKRNQEERQTDALKDVRRFAELGLRIIGSNSRTCIT